MLILKQKGQATIEYVMLFTVTMFLAGGLLFQFNDAFRNFVNGYFGAYLACLLESGELPGLGWDAGNSGQDSCNDEFEPFNIATGRQPIKAGWEDSPMRVGAVSPGQTNFRTSNSKVDAVPAESSTIGAASESQYNSGGGIPAGGGRPFETFVDRERGGGKVPLNKQDTKDDERASSYTGGELAARVGRSGKTSGRETYVPLVAAEEVRDQDKAKKKAVPANEIDIARDVKRVPAEELKKKKAALDAEEGKLDFSDFLKYLLIIGIIIAMVIFLGGQAVQISKSQEK